MTNKSQNKNPVDIVKKLAHFVKLSENKDLSKEVVAFLIEQSLFEVFGSFLSKKAIKTKIKKIFDLSLDLEEFEDPLKWLLEKKRIEATERGSFTLIPGRAKKIEEAVKKEGEREAKIYKDWLVGLKKKYKNFSDLSSRELIGDLKIYVGKVFLRHGAECAALLYKNFQVDDSLDVSLSSRSSLLKGLPNRGAEVNAVREKEFPLFFLEAPTDRKLFLSDFLDATFLYNVIAADEDCSALAKKEYRKVALLLDTNVIYGLLGLNGKDKVALTQRVLGYARQFGMKINFTQRTIEEFRRSIKITEDIVKNADLPRDLARVGAEYADEVSPLTAYWSAKSETGVSVEDFFAPFSHVEDILKRQGINQVDDLRGEIEGSEELEKEKTLLQATTGERKTDRVAEHDAYHRILVKRKRERGRRYKSRPACWFLTRDTLLPIYDFAARKEDNELPYCVLPHQLVQILRPLLPRSKDFDTTFIELLKLPNVRTFDTPAHLAQKILGTIANYKNYPPEVAASVLADKHFLQRVTEADKGKGKELIELEIVNKAKEAIKEKGELKKQLKQTESGYDKKTNDLEREIQRLQVLVGEQEKETTKYKDRAEGAEKKHSRLSKWFRWGIAIVLALGLVGLNLFVFFYLDPLNWPIPLKAGGILVNAALGGICGYIPTKSWRFAKMCFGALAVFWAIVQGLAVL